METQTVKGVWMWSYQPSHFLLPNRYPEPFRVVDNTLYFAFWWVLLTLETIVC